MSVETRARCAHGLAKCSGTRPRAAQSSPHSLIGVYCQSPVGLDRGPVATSAAVVRLRLACAAAPAGLRAAVTAAARPAPGRAAAPPPARTRRRRARLRSGRDPAREDGSPARRGSLADSASGSARRRSTPASPVAVSPRRPSACDCGRRGYRAACASSEPGSRRRAHRRRRAPRRPPPSPRPTRRQQDSCGPDAVPARQARPRPSTSASSLGLAVCLLGLGGLRARRPAEAVRAAGLRVRLGGPAPRLPLPPASESDVQLLDLLFRVALGRRLA